MKRDGGMIVPSLRTQRARISQPTIAPLCRSNTGCRNGLNSLRGQRPIHHVGHIVAVRERLSEQGAEGEAEKGAADQDRNVGFLVPVGKRASLHANGRLDRIALG